MKYVDDINMKFGGEGTKLYSTAGTSFKKICMQNKLNLLDASVRHLGTDINFIVLENLYAELKDKVTFYFDTPVKTVETVGDGYRICCENASYDLSLIHISLYTSVTSFQLSIPSPFSTLNSILPLNLFCHRRLCDHFSYLLLP